jgi:hypothetical protein
MRRLLYIIVFVLCILPFAWPTGWWIWPTGWWKANQEVQRKIWEPANSNISPELEIGKFFLYISSSGKMILGEITKIQKHPSGLCFIWIKKESGKEVRIIKEVGGTWIDIDRIMEKHFVKLNWE